MSESEDVKDQGEEIQAEQEKPAEPQKPLVPSDAEKLSRLRQYSDRIAKARSAFAEADAARKRAKADLECEREALEAYLRAMDSPQMPLPFSDQADSGDDEADAWRANPIESLCDFGLQPGIAIKLIAADIKTFGALVDFTSGDGEKSKQIEDIKGIGEKAADAIREALSGYWEHWAKAQAADLDREVASAVERLEEGRKAKATNRKAG